MRPLVRGIAAWLTEAFAAGVGWRTRREGRRLLLLSKIGTLVGSLDADEVLPAIARLSIPELADWCMIGLVEEGAIRRVKVLHRDPVHAGLAAELVRFPPIPQDRSAFARELLAGRSMLIRDYDDRTRREHAFNEEHLGLLQRIGIRSMLAVPLVIQGETVASLTFLMTGTSGRRYRSEDLVLAEELARRASQILENARLHECLRKSEERFRVALGHSNVFVFEQDIDLRYRWIYNPQVGVPAEDIIGKLDSDLLPPREAAAVTALKRRTLQTGQHARSEIDYRWNDQTYQFLVDLDPLRDEDGRITGITGAATDITSARRTEKELMAALVFRDRMMGILGHDLRNPLHAVRMSAAMLLRRSDLPEDTRKILLHIDRASARMVEMIGSLLDFTETRFTGTLPISRQPMDLCQVCQHVVEEIRSAYPERTILFEKVDEARGIWDPARMSQVASNLLQNALMHGAKGEPISVRLGASDDSVTLEVSNRGQPIPRDLLPVLFEPFRRGPTAEAAWSRGLGLGLYIVHQIVLAHGGTIDVSSKTEEGTTFTVKLPRHPPDSSS